MDSDEWVNNKGEYLLFRLYNKFNQVVQSDGGKNPSFFNEIFNGWFYEELTCRIILNKCSKI